MTDKLAEAIAYVNDFATDVDEEGLDRDGNARHFFAVIESARLYHALPVVDVDGMLLAHGQDATFGWNNCLLYLEETYPNGLVWKKDTP